MFKKSLAIIKNSGTKSFKFLRVYNLYLFQPTNVSISVCCFRVLTFFFIVFRYFFVIFIMFIQFCKYISGFSPVMLTTSFLWSLKDELAKICNIYVIYILLKFDMNLFWYPSWIRSIPKKN